MSIVNFSDLITFSRASGGGRFNAQGQYEWLASDQPRFDFDPVTLQPRGILIEEQRTNFLLYSGDRLNAAWASYFINGIWLNFWTVSPSTDVGTPVDVGVVHRYVATPTVTPLFARQYSLFAAGKSYVASIWVYVPVTPGVNRFCINANFSDKENANTLFTYEFGKWVRLSVAVPELAANRSWIDFELYVNMGARPSSGITFYATAFQLEEGSFPTSYIPTTNSQVTRAADVARVNNLSPWFNAEEGTWKVRAQGIVGSPLLTAGGSIITADSAGVKDYTLTYSSNPGAEFMQIGQGHIQKIEYYPKGNVGGW